MKNFLVIVIFAAIIVISAGTVKHCKKIHGGGLKICTKAGVITSITKLRRSIWSHNLNVSGINAIAPYAFKEVHLDRLMLSGMTKGHPCHPKFINLTTKSFSGLHGVRTLELNGLEFPVEANFFKYLSGLWLLRLRNINFTSLSPTFFKELIILHDVKLIDCSISAINRDTLSTIPTGIRRLKIRDNIGNIEPQSFIKFDRLTDLIMNGGQINHLRDGVFDGLRELKYLDLWNNSIEALGEQIFRGLKNLTFLRLSENRITELKFFTFVGLNIRYLHLAHNKLTHLPPGIFKNLPRVKELDLSYNRINIISRHVFEFMKLATVSLEFNEIHDIEPKAFAGLKLQALDLMGNKLHILKNDVFADLRIYLVLDLRRNGIIHIEPFAFRNLKAQWVDLCFKASKAEKYVWTSHAKINHFSVKKCSGSDDKKNLFSM